MTLPSLADVDALETRLGQDIADRGQAAALLDYASAVIRSYADRDYMIGDALADPLPSGVAEVCVEMVYRALSNPQGVTQQQETAGPYSHGFSFGTIATDRIFLTAADKVILRGRSRAFTIDPTPADAMADWE